MTASSSLRHRFIAIAFGGVCAVSARADLVGDVNTVIAWTRKPGQFSDIENPDRSRVRSLDPSLLKRRLSVRHLHDIQYDADRAYRAVPLVAFVDLYEPAAGLDLAILHFENGMQVSVPLAKLKAFNAYVALEACDARGKHCVTAFDEVARNDVYGDEADPRPLQFSWNKLVVAKPSVPGMPKHAGEFSPWRHVGSLSGIEFAQQAAYNRQFAVGDSGGDEVFRARCQFCHAARFVGGRFGWDFVKPLSLADKRPPENLTNHVKYRKAMAPKLGLQMPPQSDVELAEMRTLWKWMRDVTKRPLRPYAP